MMKASHNSNCFICNYVLKIPKEKTPFSIGKKPAIAKVWPRQANLPKKLLWL